MLIADSSNSRSTSTSNVVVVAAAAVAAHVVIVAAGVAAGSRISSSYMSLAVNCSTASARVCTVISMISGLVAVNCSTISASGCVDAYIHSRLRSTRGWNYSAISWTSFGRCRL